MEDVGDDDFTFPTTVADEERRDVAMPPAARLGDRRLPLLPGPAAPGASRLWPFAAPLIVGATTAATTLKEADEAPASTTRKEEEEQQDRATAAAADQDRMDMLWDDTAAAADDERAAAAAEQERMDLLWESFNEDLLLLRARSKAVDDKQQQRVDPDAWYLCPSSTWSDDAESDQETASASSPRYGCAPTMLRASSRVGGAAQFYAGGGGSSPRRRRSGSRGGGWALLLRLFRRLFAADKAPSRRHGIHVP